MMGERLASLFDGSVRQRLADALVRAAEWIGSSVTRETYDDKVVDLCAALECMLATKDDKRRGEALAFR